MVDYRICGENKSIVYAGPVGNVEIICQRVEQGCQQTQHTCSIWDRVRQSTTLRLESCIGAHGGHFEHHVEVGYLLKYVDAYARKQTLKQRYFKQTRLNKKYL